MAWFTVRRSGFRILCGEPKSYRSSGVATRSFCANCGTQLTFAYDEWPDYVDVTTGSLDDPHLVPPKDHTRTSAQLPWLQLTDGLPRFLEAREQLVST